MFLTRFLLVTIVLVALSSPLFALAWRKRKDHTTRNFLVAALIIAVLCGILAESSARLVRQCLESGSPGCVDIGAGALQMLLAGLYIVMAGAMTCVIWRE
ncbi:MAG: hypothetical protein KY394_06930 [Actinobacteria bacterium]|nr:hypothetical protein [Actinomycetota bacterium]